MRKCKHCLQSIDGTVSQYANHVRWCDQNPKVQQYKEDNITRGKSLGNQRFGNIIEFKVCCANCEKEFVVKEREFLFPTKEKYFCSRNCANATGGKAKAEKHHYDEIANYTTVAWRYHDKKCVVCGEYKIVAVHHLNENHNDNDPKNLIPLCPTHHQYMHSRYKVEIQDIVLEYVKEKWAVSVDGDTRALQA